MPEFHFQELFELGDDDTAYRSLGSEFVSTQQLAGREVLVVQPEALRGLAAAAIRDVSHLFRTGHLEQLRAILEDPEASANDRFVALEMLKNANVSAGMVLPSCQDTGTAIVIGKKGENVFTGADDEEEIARGIYDTYTGTNLRYSQMAPTHDVRREEHGQQPAGADRALREAGGRVRVPVHHERRRLGEQIVPLSGNARDPEPREHSQVLRREDEVIRNGRVPSVSPRDRDRRNERRVQPENGEARELPLSRFAPDDGQRARPSVSRRRHGRAGAQAVAAHRHRRAVRRKIFLPRRARDSPSAPRCVAADRHRRLVQCGPPGEGQDHEARRLPRTARDESGAVHAGRHASGARRRGRRDRPESADERDPQAALALPR